MGKHTLTDASLRAKLRKKKRQAAELLAQTATKSAWCREITGVWSNPSPGGIPSGSRSAHRPSLFPAVSSMSTLTPESMPASNTPMQPRYLTLSTCRDCQKLGSKKLSTIDMQTGAIVQSCCRKIAIDLLAEWKRIGRISPAPSALNLHNGNWTICSVVCPPP